jgi:hypothetical protein
MKTFRFYWMGFTLSLALTAPLPTSAQMANFYTSPGYNNFVNTLITNHIWNSSMSRYTGNYKGGSGGSGSKSPSQPAIEEVPAYRQYPAVKFKSTGTRLTLQEYVDAIQGPPEVKAQAKDLIVGIFKNYEATTNAKTYPNDWALAFVSYVGLNTHVYKGVKEKPIIPLEQNVGLRDVVAEQATNNGLLSNISDRQKQEQYELFVMTGGLTYHFYEEALRANNAEELNQMKLRAAENLKLVGIRP